MSMNISEANKTFMKIFEQMHIAGLLDRNSIRTLASAWHAESGRAGCDVTHGLLRMVTDAIKLSSAELSFHQEDVGRVEIDSSVDGRLTGVTLRARSRAQPGLVPAPMPLYGVGTTQRLSVGVVGKRKRAQEASEGASQRGVLRARLPECAGIRALNDGSRLVVIVTATRKGLLMATNNVANRLFCSTTEITALMHQHRMLPMHVLASMISPADRHLLYEAEVSMLCSQVRPYTALVKFCGRNGQPQLHNLQARAMQLSEVPEARGPATVLTLERCPASDYGRMRPAHWHRSFEVHRQEPKAVGNGTRSGAIAPHPALPRIADLRNPPRGVRDPRTALWRYHHACARPLPVTITDHASSHRLDHRRHGNAAHAPPGIVSISHPPSVSDVVPGLVSYGIHSYSSTGLPVLISYSNRCCSDGALRGFEFHMSDSPPPVRDGRNGCTSGPSGALGIHGCQVGTLNCMESGGEGFDWDEWLEEVAACLGY